VLRDDKNEPMVYVQADRGSSRSAALHGGAAGRPGGDHRRPQEGETVVSDGSLFLQFANTIK